MDEQDESHMAEMFGELRDIAVFVKKGPRTALRRWYSWFLSRNYHSKYWHVKLLIICFVGLKTGVYKSLAGIPLSQSSSCYGFKADLADDGWEPDPEDVANPEEAQKAIEDEVKKADDGKVQNDEKQPVSKGSRSELKALYKK